jgi:hypothetical protein
MGTKSQGYAANHPFFISLFSFNLFGKFDSIESMRFISPMKFGFQLFNTFTFFRFLNSETLMYQGFSAIDF